MSIETWRPTDRVRHGIAPTRVVPARIDRLAWSTTAPSRDVRLRRGEVSARPIARSASATLHLAVDRDGGPAYVLRSRGAFVAARSTDIETVWRMTSSGIATPMVRRVEERQLWIEWHDWNDSRRPDPAALDHYVCGVIRSALVHSTIVGSGRPHVTADGGVGSLDVFVARRLEPDERHELTSLWESLLRLDATGVADAASRLSGARPSRLPAAATRAVLSLAAEWTPTSLGLSLHHISRAASDAGPRAEPLVLLADEFLHRLDLAHQHRLPILPLRTRLTALSLAPGVATSP